MPQSTRDYYSDVCDRTAILTCLKPRDAQDRRATTLLRARHCDRSAMLHCFIVLVLWGQL